MTLQYPSSMKVLTRSLDGADRAMSNCFRQNGSNKFKTYQKYLSKIYLIGREALVYH